MAENLSIIAGVGLLILMVFSLFGWGESDNSKYQVTATDCSKQPTEYRSDCYASQAEKRYNATSDRPGGAYPGGY